MMQRGHVSLPNGMGVSHPGTVGRPWASRSNELTSAARRDKFFGRTPWHKHVPARIEPVAR